MAITFDDASQQYLSVAASPVTASPLTMAGWIKVDATNVSHCLFFLGDGGSDNNSWAIFDATSGDARFRCDDDGTLQDAYADTGDGIILDTWVHFAAVAASDSSRKMYVNGVVGTEATTTLTPTVVNIDLMAIGVLPRATNTMWVSGAVAEVGLWDYALSAGQVGNLYTDKYAPSLVQAANLQGYWDLIADANDDSGNGNNMTASGSPSYTTHVPGIVYSLGVSIPVLAANHYRRMRA